MGEATGNNLKENPNAARWGMSDVPDLPKMPERKNDNAEQIGELSREKEQKTEELREEISDIFHPPQEFTPEKPSQPEVVPTEKVNKPASPVLQTLKRVATATGGTVLLGASAVSIAFAPMAIPLAIPAAVVAADAIMHSIRGVNGSMFQVDRKNRIKQRFNPLPLLFKHHGEDSEEVFEDETKKLFEGLKSNETYTTHSHIMTYALLRKAQSEGRITELTKKENGESRLFFENLATRNWKAIRSGKKHKMYDISFKMV